MNFNGFGTILFKIYDLEREREREKDGRCGCVSFAPVGSMSLDWTDEKKHKSILFFTSTTVILKSTNSFCRV